MTKVMVFSSSLFRNGLMFRSIKNCIEFKYGTLLAKRDLGLFQGATTETLKCLFLSMILLVEILFNILPIGLMHVLKLLLLFSNFFQELSKDGVEEVYKLIVGNKSDLAQNRQVSTEEGMVSSIAVGNHLFILLGIRN